MKKRFRLSILVLTVSFFIGQTAWATQGAPSKSIFDVMNYQEVLNISIEGDFETLKNNRKNKESHKGTLTFKDENKVKQHWNIKLKLRGHFRRMTCEMPPLKVDFKKSDLTAAGLAKFDDLKLVTHCSDNKEEAKEWLKREYLTYKLYQELTPNSFRVQMLKITYVDINTGKKTKNWGFFIEDTAQLAARMNAKKIEQWGLQAEDFQTLDLKVMSLFQYMIGNTDWDINTSRNLKMFIKDGKVIPVPYDFDYSGLVSTSYARPNTNYGLTTLKERAYIGFKEDLNDMHDTRAIFAIQQAALEEIILESRMMHSDSKTEIQSYLKEFFLQIDDIQFKELLPPQEANIIISK